MGKTRLKNIDDVLKSFSKEEIFNIFNNCKSKSEIYKFFKISDNQYGKKIIDELAKLIDFDFNIYKERKRKYCLECGKQLKNGQKKFCCSSCFAKYNNRLRGRTSYETRRKISEGVKKYYEKNKVKKVVVCKICGREECKKEGICKHTKKFFENLSYFGFNLNTIGTQEVFKEYERIKEKLEYEYFVKKLSPSDLKRKYNYPKTFENITHILKRMGIKTRGLSESVVNGCFTGNVVLPKIYDENGYKFKHGWHTSWDGEKFYYRSSKELKFAKSLDEQKIKYKVECLRIKYFDSVLKKTRIAIPDFLLIEDNIIVEVKERVTFKKQNMIDKFNEYKKLGYTPKLLYKDKFYDDKEMLKIEEFYYTL